MTKKILEQVARNFKEGYDLETDPERRAAFRQAVYGFMQVASALNPRFSDKKFRKASGIDIKP